MKVPTSEKWRDANKPVKTLLGLNPWLLLIFLITLFYLNLWTILLCISLTLFFGIVEYKGVPALMALRWLRSQLTFRRKLIRPWWNQ